MGRIDCQLQKEQVEFEKWPVQALEECEQCNHCTSDANRIGSVTFCVEMQRHSCEAQVPLTSDVT